MVSAILVFGVDLDERFLFGLCEEKTKEIKANGEDLVRNMDVLHSSLRPYNQTWWQVHENGSYYETGIEIEYETEL